MPHSDEAAFSPQNSQLSDLSADETDYKSSMSVSNLKLK
jgi:hypothetical protein